MYRVEEGFLLASLLKAKVKYFYEEFVTISELRHFERELYQKSGELGISLVCVSQYDLQDYFSYHGSNACYTIKEGVQLSNILRRFEGYLPVDVLKLLYSDEFMLELFIRVEQEEIREQKRTLEKKELLLKQLELRDREDKEKSR